MLEILLVFVITGYEPTVSDRVFPSYEKCATFVNQLAGQYVVNSDYGFEFLTSDGLIVSGQCISRDDWGADV